MIKKDPGLAEESSSADEDDEEINMDEEYKAFVEQYGNLDFHLLNFMPKIKTTSELLDTRKKLQDQVINKSNQIVTKNCERMARFQANSELGQIKEELEEEQYGSETDNTRERRSSKKSRKSKRTSIYPQLFDFRFNNKYYILNIKIDPKGERIQAISNLQGRVVSEMPLTFAEPVGQKGTIGRHSRDTVPLESQRSKYYFQYRIDSLS